MAEGKASTFWIGFSRITAKSRNAAAPVRIEINGSFFRIFYRIAKSSGRAIQSTAPVISQMKEAVPT